MITVVQRVLSASVVVDGTTVGAIDHGLLALVAVTRTDTEADVQWTADKLPAMRIFRSEEGDKHFDLDVRQVNGSILLVSQFTLAADTRRGRRPSFDPAAPPELARRLFDDLVARVRATGVPVATGQFQADMKVSQRRPGHLHPQLARRIGRPLIASGSPCPSAIGGRTRPRRSRGSWRRCPARASGSRRREPRSPPHPPACERPHACGCRSR